MKRLLGIAAAIGLLFGSTPAHSQEVLGYKFDLGLYGGGAWSSDWFSIGEANFGSDWSPVFGATGSYWFNPTVGARLNGSYLPMRAPTTSSETLFVTSDGTEILTPLGLTETSGWPVNTWMADLSLSYKPWAEDKGNFFASTYLWGGFGAVWSNFAGESPEEVLVVNPLIVDADYVATCVSGDVPVACFDRGTHTSGQATFGIGFDMISLGSRFGFYGELGGNVYNAPVGTNFDEVIIEDLINEEVVIITQPFESKTAFTGRATAGIKMAVGEILAPVVPIPPPPPPPPPPPAERRIQVCVVENGQVHAIEATIRPSSGDTMVANVEFSRAHPATLPNYAVASTWFLQSDEIRFMDREHVKFGVTRVIAPAQLQRVGEYQGTPIFAEAGRTGPFELVYVPVRPGCEFQPYQVREQIRPRG